MEYIFQINSDVLCKIEYHSLTGFSKEEIEKYSELFKNSSEKIQSNIKLNNGKQKKKNTFQQSEISFFFLKSDLRIFKISYSDYKKTDEIISKIKSEVESQEMTLNEAYEDYYG